MGLFEQKNVEWVGLNLLKNNYFSGVFLSGQKFVCVCTRMPNCGLFSQNVWIETESEIDSSTGGVYRGKRKIATEKSWVPSGGQKI